MYERQQKMYKALKIELKLGNEQKIQVNKTIEDLKLNDRIYKCCNCGLEMDRDYNTSINLEKAKVYKIIA